MTVLLDISFSMPCENILCFMVLETWHSLFLGNSSYNIHFIFITLERVSQKMHLRDIFLELATENNT